MQCRPKMYTHVTFVIFTLPTSPICVDISQRTMAGVNIGPLAYQHCRWPNQGNPNVNGVTQHSLHGEDFSFM